MPALSIATWSLPILESTWFRCVAPSLVPESACSAPIQPAPLDLDLPWALEREEAGCILALDMLARATVRVGRARAYRPPLSVTIRPNAVTDGG